MKDRSKQPGPDSPGVRQKVEALRLSLLRLHKTLVESERVQYEEAIGKIQSPNHFLQLLTDDPWFAWLSPLSQLIVAIDETLDAREPLTRMRLESLSKEIGRLLIASETGTGFPRHYFEALQRDPDVVMAHADVAKLSRNGKPG